MQVDIHEAQTNLSRLLELVEQGESVLIARHGKPVARLVGIHQNAGLPLGIARNAPLASSGDDWWQPLTDSEVEDWIEGR